ncbi:MAG: uncharacterized protein KVP18_002547 [Porospora cf. gigantea A]|uniref:uncharacterized protein n=1 Tax=Porospora cf. gigantea A TaxID=2853593 RepID=UPI00355980AE|nr:MAG: hypothetical protein KVP18_002547 [Porospora cf. gigantea A]
MFLSLLLICSVGFAEVNLSDLAESSEQQAEIGDTIKNALKNDTLPECDMYDQNPGSCDPENALEKCIACKRKGLTFLSSHENRCPGQQAIKHSLRDKYMFVASYQSALSSRLKRKVHICRVTSATKTEIEENEARKGGAMGPQPAVVQGQVQGQPQGQMQGQSNPNFEAQESEMYMMAGVGLLAFMCIGGVVFVTMR